MIIGEAKAMRYLPSRRAYVQDKVRPGTGREGALGYERYAAGAWMHRSGQARPVALDTRLPASYGPDRHYPPQLQHQATCIFQRSLVQTLAENPGFSNSESPLFSLSETIDLCIRTKLRMCGTFLPDLLRQESRMSATWMMR